MRTLHPAVKVLLAATVTAALLAGCKKNEEVPPAAPVVTTPEPAPAPAPVTPATTPPADGTTPPGAMPPATTPPADTTTPPPPTTK